MLDAANVPIFDGGVRTSRIVVSRMRAPLFTQGRICGAEVQLWPPHRPELWAETQPLPVPEAQWTGRYLLRH